MSDSQSSPASQPSGSPEVWGRRRFLAAVLSGAATLILQACGRERRVIPPDPTAIPATATAAPAARQSQYMPLVANQHRAATTRTPVPTEAPTAVPAEPPPPTSTTPAPTATSRPPATPFPPGPPSKLGVFLGYHHPQLFDLLSTGNIALVKTLEYNADFVASIKRVSPNTVVIARYTPLEQFNLAAADPAEAARRFADLILPIATDPVRQANIDAWEAYNEPVPAGHEQMARLAAFEAERTRLLAAAGIRSCIGNFGTGQPALEQWPAFFPAIQAIQEHNGYLGLHEYSAPYLWFGTGAYQFQPGVDEGDEGWLTLRYRKVYRQYLQPAGLEVPLLITETGIDGSVANRPGPAGSGWRDFRGFWQSEGRVTSSAAGFYVEQLTWYDAELAQDPYVKGAAIFALAGPQGWESFEMLGECARILQQYLAVHPRG
ncbi:MAG: hypothetical protein M5U01_12515 [Ardenticatenaceae bacterium]|nr:hypothetical protein [Ardenticatenaceae bacterium]